MGTSFNALWTGQSISLMGDYIAYFTVPVYVLELTDRASAFTTIYAFENFPTLLFGFAGGVLVDRMNRRRVALFSDLMRAGAFGLLAILASSDQLTIWMLALLSFVIGSMAASFNAALMSFVPSVVGSERLALANSRLAISQQIAFASGPVIGAVLLELTDSFALTFIFNGSTFLVSAISLMLARPLTRQARTQSGGYFDEMKAGLAFLWHRPLLRWTVLAGSAANFVLAFVESTLVLLSRQVLGIEGDFQLGLVFGALGIGGIIGALSASIVIRRIGLGRTFVAGFFIFGGGLLVLTGQSSLRVVLVAILVGFIGIPWINVALVTIRQLESPDEMLGRITAASRAVAWGSLPLGAIIAGYLADNVFGLDGLLLAAPIAILILGAVLVLSPVWRTGDL